jgi:hypothetical protein
VYLRRARIGIPSLSETDRHLIHAYSIFDSGAYRNHAAEWLFPQEKATMHRSSMATSESKML